MSKRTKLYNTALLLLLAGSSTSVSAVDLGDYNGVNLRVGGYIKAEAVINRPDSDAAFNADTSFKGHLRESRINLSASSEVNGHQLKGFIESDFYGNYFASGTNDLRLRHAYFQLDNWTLGKTWSGQFFAVAPLDARVINFWGSGAGTIAGTGSTVRPDLLIHYRKNGFIITAQDPIYDDANIPDLVASYTKRFDGGSGLTFALTGREVENGTDSDFGAGVSLAGQLGLGPHRLHASAFTGEGMGAYSGVGVGGAFAPNTVSTTDAEDGDLVSQIGFSVGYTHQITEKLTGVARYGQVSVDDSADTSMKMTNVNVVYAYLPNLDLGIEWRHQNIDTLNTPIGGPFPNIRPKGEQVELMAKLKF